MVKTPKTRHSKTQRDPVTIDLEPDAVTRMTDAEPAAAEDGVAPGDTAQESAPIEVERPQEPSGATDESMTYQASDTAAYQPREAAAASGPPRM